MQLSQHSQLPTHHQSTFKLIYPPTSLHHTSVQNAKRIHQLEHLIRAERQELQRLLANNNNNKRSRHSSPSSSSAPSTPSLSTTMPIPTTPPAISSPTPHTSPKGIMDTYQTQPTTHAPPPRKPQIREMAARGSHWSFVEKARFEAALHKYGPFAWDQIIRTVGTRSEKQVKAYAARYRRRKKLAAKAQLEAAELLPIQKPTPLAPSLSTLHSLHRPLRPSPTPPPPPPPLPPPPITTEQQTCQPGQNPPELEPLHIEGLLPSDNPSVDESAFCDDIFAGSSLFDASLVDSSEQLPEVDQQTQPTEVELLVDQALRGDYVLDDKPPEEVKDTEALPDAFPTEFLNSVFTH